jgi:hypothetical protein
MRFPFQAILECTPNRFRQRLTGGRGKGAGQAVGLRVFDADSHLQLSRQVYRIL